MQHIYVHILMLQSLSSFTSVLMSVVYLLPCVTTLQAMVAVSRMPKSMDVQIVRVVPSQRA